MFAQNKNRNHYWLKVQNQNLQCHWYIKIKKVTPAKLKKAQGKLMLNSGQVYTYKIGHNMKEKNWRDH